MSAARWTLIIWGGLFGFFYSGVAAVNAQETLHQTNSSTSLTVQEVAFVKISIRTATGNLDQLDAAIRSGLECGLTVNQIKTTLEQLYAYCGFPRSLNGITRLMAVLEDRRQHGIHDEPDPFYQPETQGDRYEQGRATLEQLTGTPQSRPAPGFGEFSPEIDRFLKEHLFADIFNNPTLTFKQRELITIAALATMDGVEPQLKSHIHIGKHIGLTSDQLAHVSQLLENSIGRPQANRLRKLLGLPELATEEIKLLVRISEIQIASEHRDAYLAILQDEARMSIEREPGVISIFPMVHRDESTQVKIIEIYKDQAAYQSHIASPHFQHYKTSTLSMVKSLKLIDMHVVDIAEMEKSLSD